MYNLRSYKATKQKAKSKVEVRVQESEAWGDLGSNPDSAYWVTLNGNHLHFEWGTERNGELPEFL